MKKIVILAILFSFVASAFAQESPETKNAYVDPKSELERYEKIETEKTSTQVISIPDGVPSMKDKKYMTDDLVKTGGTITIEYNPLYNEARIYYTCTMVKFDKGQAMNIVLAVLQDFCAATEYTNQNGTELKKERYYHYADLTQDEEKYFKDKKGKKWGQYRRYIKFTK